MAADQGRRLVHRRQCGVRHRVRTAHLSHTRRGPDDRAAGQPRRSEEHTSELQSLMRISYAVFCLKKKNTKTTNTTQNHNPQIYKKNIDSHTCEHMIHTI